MIERFFVWLWRIGRCRGFGIQSPWAYAFVRYIINEHYPYYAYERLMEHGRSEHLSAIDRKRGMLYFRMANYLQPRCVLNIGDRAARYAVYFHEGCNKVDVLSVSDIKDVVVAERASHCSLVRVATDTVDIAAIKGLCSQLADGSMLVIEDIGRSRCTRRLWKQLTAKESGIVTFDLYYCGIICFASSRHKQNYVINF